MSLDALLETAYRRGTGVSRRYALSTARVRELTQEFKKESPSVELAEFAYLGERLADTAYRQLPKKLQDSSKSWPRLTPAKQQAVLVAIMDSLGSSQWRHYRKLKKNPRDYGRPESVLPSQYGSWSRGKVQPNCLGVSQLLVGFARAANAPHLLVNVITRSDEVAHMSLHLLIQDLLSAVDSRKNLALRRRLQVILEQWNREVLKHLVQLYSNQQAHHALMIRLKGGQWYVVDPYMGSLGAPFDGHKETDREFSRYVLNVINKNPLQTAVVGDVAGTAEYENTIEWYIRRMIRQFRRLVKDSDETVETIQRVFTQLKKHAIIERYVEEIGECELKVWLGRNAVIVTRGMTSKQITQKVQQAKRHLKVNARDRHRAYNRAVRGICKIISEIAYDVARPTIAPTMEIVHPTIQLGVNTVHHLAVRENKLEPTLLRFTKSQFILRDIAGDVGVSGDEEAQKLIEEKFTYWKDASKGKTPLMTIPGIKPYLIDKEIQENGKSLT